MSWFRKAALASAAFFSLCLAGCSGLSTAARLESARELGAAAGFSDVAVEAAGMRLLALARFGKGEGRLRVYIEGDGAPWMHPLLPPADPTPLRPLALELAVRDPGRAVAYLARPCQYLPSPSCGPAYWTAERFSPPVLAAYNAALDELKARSGAASLSLAGYSGGGVLAALLASVRADVVEVLTVAAPLDTRAWVAHHGASPLAGGDPAAHPGRLAALPQRHWVGQRDEVVPPEIVAAYARRLGRPETLVPVADFDHECCWAERWPELLAGLPRAGAEK